MTEYGRGQGSEPWHPEDPLYGDQGWHGQQQAAHGPDAYAPQGGQYPQAEHYPQGGQWDTGQWETGQWDAAQTGQWDTGQWNSQAAQYTGQGRQYQQQSQGWDPSPGGATGHAPGPGDPYGRQEPDPYGTDHGHPDPYSQSYGYQQPQQMRSGPAGGPGPFEQNPHTGYGTQEMPHIRPEEPRQPHPPQRPGGAEADGWDDEPDEPEHAFFRQDRDEHDHYADEDAPDRRCRPRLRGGRGDGPSKPGRRSGLACLLVGAVLVGGVGGAGWFGYQFWESRFADAPDYSGDGSGSVQIEIPSDTSLAGMGRILKSKGVVKSVDAFVEAADTPKGRGIQSGIYTLHRRMSAEAAVEMMTDPAAMNALIIREGMRASQVYAAIDDKLGVKAGTTKKVAKSDAGSLGLPRWAAGNRKAMDPLEGFLFPSRYDAAEGSKPADVLRQMVQRATKQYEQQGVVQEAKKLGLDSPLELVTVASLVQAEGMTHDDFRKMARVVYNRLKAGNTETNGRLEFDSTYNYLKGQSKIDLDPNELRTYDHPYNTYFYKGLPPGPIGNPGDEAVNAAIHPERGSWYYFVSIKGKTKFADTLEEHNKLVREFNRSRRDG
ncbi:endolytic transglycosylase MltG [Streptomyces meridianus]|uniref:Endolytic murein transglycosylase n=1 Tax=Streptomyces meridianus TaxID=2938945 RepID=A0ABT0XAA4_9ACTN|nr:endolytic transglycosylase MltG [Streptomyces meridianus]MCM2579461.1 endolytic transglycosylase MltG [Streptomyces meridianus]